MARFGQLLPVSISLDRTPEGDQVLRLLLPLLRGLARDAGLDRERRHDASQNERERSDQHQPPVATSQVALLEHVEADAEQARDELEPCVGFSVGSRPTRGSRSDSTSRARA